MSVRHPPQSVLPERIRLIRRLHATRRGLGLDEAEYRACLVKVTGEASSAALSIEALRAVLAALGAMSGAGAGKPFKQAARPGIRLIFGLWTELGRLGLIDHPGREALFRFVKRMTGVDHPDWLTNHQANAVIEALKAMRARGHGTSQTGVHDHE
jgi:hypothetical protein